jgi:malonate transporter and related proteins
VYYLLFPCLLFAAIVRTPISMGTLAQLGGVAITVNLIGIALAYLMRYAPGVDGLLHASGAQTAFRFNTYVALALAERLAGAPGLAWVALLVAVCVPVSNVAAVWPLARHGGKGVLGELLRNPLIVSTVAGLTFNLCGLSLPDLAATTLTRIGAAALPLGLMAVGAGLRFGALREAPWLAAGFMAIRHLVLPGVAIALVIGFALPRDQQLVMVAFASVPTASSAYVLATRMGGNGGFVAGLVTVSTLLAMAGMPLALGLLAALR